MSLARRGGFKVARILPSDDLPTGLPGELQLAMVDGALVVVDENDNVVSLSGLTTFNYQDNRPSYLGAASAHDIEFGNEAPTDKGWAHSSSPSGTPDIRALNNTAAHKVGWSGSFRDGHGAVQTIDASSFEITKTITPAAESWIWARNIMDTNAKDSPTNIICNYMYLRIDDGDLSDSIEAFAGAIDIGGTDFAAAKRETNASTPGTAAGASFAVYGSGAEELFIQRSTDDYEIHAKIHGSWRYLGGESKSTSMPRVAMGWHNDGDLAPGTSIHYPKFFRYGTGLLTRPPG